MTKILIDQPTSATNRKVRMATVAASISTPLSYLLAVLIVDAVPRFQTTAGMQAMASLLEILIATGLTALTTWAAGYYFREEA